MSMVRGIFGAALGAATAGIALRIRAVSKQRGQSLADVAADLPGILAEDATRIADAARHALEDGREASRSARIDFDEQVASRSRRTKGNDV
ncbi:MAG: hypothetical protein JWL76_1376 [Thermoleophilia bacterium]|nr:hypothetical protein [Thermoleophilia bacterium]